jgi:hypothetical protein
MKKTDKLHPISIRIALSYFKDTIFKILSRIFKKDGNQNRYG